MNKETYTTWYNGLKERLATGHINQEHYETLIVDNLSSLITHFFNSRYDDGHMSLEEHFALVNHYFELVADAEISERSAMLMVRSVASSIQKLPAAKAFAEKHNTPAPSIKEILGSRPGLLRKHAASTTEKMIGCPVITQVNEPENEVTIELPWKTALHVYKGFLVKALMSKHGYKYSDAYNYITDHQNKYDELLAEVLNSIIANEESHLVSVGGGITAAGTGLAVSGIIKPEE
ncbi:hypothetical protein MADMEL_72 [Erwinia phage vB_EamM_MadMel]|uniref:Uncharacterized protein n=2 Tax=Agricanvirus TaxID=1984776 RepID=A0A173GDA0_9CAUD|nr:hypothetical protein FDH99_gp073 [Erwinia phage vB_EamM_Simmy50]ANH51535.1 hypothetical protein SIMMY50_73 [Erwinia phage vB_EamM_Simmy50]AUG86500.1 hypothetical protein MADMEL_72 [Erwinia phage vB_EamM_MadMel]